jgi:hypothetical protein
MFKLLLPIVFITLIFSCKAPSDLSDNAPKESENLVGGWSVTEMNESIEPAFQFALNQLNINLEDISKIISVRQQVVSGMNYHIVFELKSKTQWSVFIYKNIKGKMILTNSEKL